MESVLKHNSKNKYKVNNLTVTDVEANVRILKEVNHCLVGQEIAKYVPVNNKMLIKEINGSHEVVTEVG